ncbi:MAG TPA: glycine cleavage T C-terminal barrel domain-containing protein, partial [Xanthomonadales bacterium]|nr:glycine cleavage T C-terminal barrel domain-containing protein [Xanthomonadales bacterium]
VLAGGAIEQGLVFPNNDRPGVMLAGAVRHYLNRYAVTSGRRALIACNNDSAYQTAIDLSGREIDVAGVVDSRQEINPLLFERMSGLGVKVYPGSRIANTRGTKRIRSARIETMEGKTSARLECDLLGISGGWAPRVHLLCHARGSLRFDPAIQGFLPDRLPAGFVVLGAAGGIFNPPACMAHSVKTTISLCAELGYEAHSAYQPPLTQAICEAESVGPAGLHPSKRRQWIDLSHDVTFGDAELAVREGFEAVEHFKRYTTTGMSVDQGKTGNINAFLALSALTGRDINEIGTTTFRPPYMPVSLGAVAGRNLGEFYAPRRYLPAHGIHKIINAEFEDYGGWQRPDIYPLKGESRKQTIEREACAVRSTVGVFDNSPIGKIEVFGPDAAEFLNRIYINKVDTLQSGRVRYGLMLNENGVIVDDGVFSRLADNHFLVNTTSGGVRRILAHMEECQQCEWPDLRVMVDDVTTTWANFTLAGPRARNLIQALGCDIDLNPDHFPHMSIACGCIAGETVRLARVSFSGELSYEINLPAERAYLFLTGLMRVGEEFEITPYGIEALMLLRLEKGYLHVGSDTDGETTPDDVGWGGPARSKPTDYIGKRSLQRSANLDQNRKQLVGIVPLDDQRIVRPGTHLLIGENRKAPAITDGWITSAAWSPNLRRTIALGVVRGGSKLQGSVLTAIDENERYAVSITSTPFLDPDNERLHS